MDGGKSYNKEIFRLAATLFRGDSYNVKRENLVRKIIESVYLKENRFLDVGSLIDQCKSLYGLEFAEEEILEVLDLYLDKFEYKRIGNESNYRLTNKRYSNLTENLNKGIDCYIDEFIIEKDYDSEKERVKDILHRFLYETFTTNHHSYEKMLNSKNIRETMSIESENYGREEKELINEFLNYDNVDKDKAIFNIVTLALEYCLLTSGNTKIYREGIGNKVFYIDTNIIYRCIGVNGQRRKETTDSFLKKCVESGSQLKISKSVDEEFNVSINKQIHWLSQKKSLDHNIKIYSKYSEDDDIFKFYKEWRSGKQIKGFDYFKAHIMTQYEDFLKKFNIEIDYKEYWDNKEDQMLDILSSVRQFKEFERIPYNDKIYEYDAKLIMTVNELRKSKNEVYSNILETKNFIISTDQRLKEWDYKSNEDKTPKVLLPSQWLAIMLRFVGRTEDDYESFVSFLGLSNNTSSISINELEAIVTGISELTDDFSSKEIYAKNIIELDANNILKASKTIVELYENTKEYVESEIQKENKEYKNKNEDYNRTIKELQSEKEISENMLKSENEQLKEEIKKDQEMYLRNYMSNWRKYRVAYGVIILLTTLSFFLAHFVLINNELNFIRKFYESAIDLNSEGLYGAVIGTILVTVSGVGVKVALEGSPNSKKYLEIKSWKSKELKDRKKS